MPESSTLTSAGSGRAARLASAADSFASAALPGAPAQALPPNSVLTWLSTASPMRRSRPTGTSGASSSAASGTR
jgi:hypothetical protein